MQVFTDSECSSKFIVFLYIHIKLKEGCHSAMTQQLTTNATFMGSIPNRGSELFLFFRYPEQQTELKNIKRRL